MSKQTAASNCAQVADAGVYLTATDDLAGMPCVVSTSRSPSGAQAVSGWDFVNSSVRNCSGHLGVRAESFGLPSSYLGKIRGRQAFDRP